MLEVADETGVPGDELVRNESLIAQGPRRELHEGRPPKTDHIKQRFPFSLSTRPGSISYYEIRGVEVRDDGEQEKNPLHTADPFPILKVGAQVTNEVIIPHRES